MAIDKIVIQYEAQVAEFKRELDGIKAQLKSVETTAASGAKKTEKSLNDVGKGANDLKETIKGLGQQIAAAFAAREIIRFTKQTIDAASDLNETLSKSQQIFGDASKAVEEFASNSAKQFGMSKQTAIDAAASFGVFGKSAGLTGQDLSKFSTDLVALSADLASFGNTTPEEAALALGAALRGEAEPIRRFGVLMDEATLKQEALAMGLIKTTKGALTPQQKVLAANALIFKQTADAQGDFARTSDGVANQQRILEATFKDLQTEVGQKLLPTFNSTLKSLNQILENLDADTVMSFAKAAGAAALAFGGWKLGPLVSMLPQVAKGIMTMNTATLALNKTLKTNLFTAAFAFALPYIIDFIDGVDEAGEEVDQLSERQEELKSVTERLVEAETEQLGVANNYFSALSKTNPKSQERKELIDEINKRYGTTLKNLSDEVAFQNQLKEAQDKVIEGIKAKIALQIQEEKYTTLLKQRAKFAGQATQEEAKLNALEKKFLEERGMTVAQYNESLVEQRLNELALSETEKEIAEQRRRAVSTGDELLVQIEKQAKAYDVAQNEVTKIDSEINNLDADTKNLVNSMSSLFETTNDGTEGNENAAKALAQFNKEMRSLADELTLMMIADEDERGRKQLEIQKQNDLASIEAAEFSAEQKGQLKAKIEDKYNQLELTRQQAQNEKLKKAEEDYQRFLEEQGLQSEDAAKDAEDRKYSAYLELWQRKQENELLGIKNEKERKLRELAIQEENEIAKIEGTEYSEQIILEIKKKYAAKRVEVEKETQKQTYISLSDGLSTLSSNFGQMVSAFAQMSGEGAEYTKALAVVGVQIQMASALAAAIAGAVQAASATGPGAPFALAGYIAAMVGAVVSAFAQTQQLLTAEVPKPSFYDGTAYLQRGGNPKGKDTIPVMAHEGEAIIPTKKNLQYPGLAKSWINGNLDGYIHNQFVRPALIDQQQKAEEDFADRLAASMALQMSSQFDDYRLHRDMKEQTAVLRNGFYHLKENRKKIRGGR